MALVTPEGTATSLRKYPKMGAGEALTVRKLAVGDHPPSSRDVTKVAGEEGAVSGQDCVAVATVQV